MMMIRVNPLHLTGKLPRLGHLSVILLPENLGRHRGQQVERIEMMMIGNGDDDDGDDDDDDDDNDDNDDDNDSL